MFLYTVSVIYFTLIFGFRYLRVSCSLDVHPTHPFEELEGQLPSVLVEELFGIILLIGRLKDLPANIQNAFTIQNPGKVLLLVRYYVIETWGYRLLQHASVKKYIG